MGYVDEVLEVVKKKNADQPEFLQAVTGTGLLYHNK